MIRQERRTCTAISITATTTQGCLMEKQSILRSDVESADIGHGFPWLHEPSGASGAISETAFIWVELCSVLIFDAAAP